MASWLLLHGSGRIRADAILYVCEGEDETGYALGEGGCSYAFRDRAEEVARHLRELGYPLLEYKDSQNGRIWISLRRVVRVAHAGCSTEKNPQVYVGFNSFQGRNLFRAEGMCYLTLDLPLAEVEQALDALEN